MNNYKNVIKELRSKYKNFNILENDIDAFQYYKDFSIVYNKFQIAQDQNLICGIYPIKPIQYPVVSKPIYNLLGMGTGSKKITNCEELDCFNNGNFWCEFLNGDHYSWDLIVRNGIILYHTCFLGVKKTFGTFEYWKQLELGIPKNVYFFLNKYLKNFTGNVNLETIGGKVIEIHLRMGDIDLVDYDVIKLSILNLIEKNDDIIKIQMNIINQKKINYIYLVPVWEKLDKFINLENKYNYIKEHFKYILDEDDNITSYYFDDVNHPNPDGYKRWFLLLSYDLKKTIKIKNKMENLIKNINLPI